MNKVLSEDKILLRQIEREDLPALQRWKNDPEIVSLLGGFSRGYTADGMQKWLEYHRGRSDEVLLAIVDMETEACLGHVGFYQIDHRVRSAEFAILLGDKSRWGAGLGSRITGALLSYGFDELNLNRVELSVLVSNQRALKSYARLGFQSEGTRREAQFRGGKAVDVCVMSLLRREYR
jgi:RimJ/RimL family protein N-acetyltransferase